MKRTGAAAQSGGPSARRNAAALRYERRTLCFSRVDEPIRSEQMTFLIDLHHLGGQQTGNETIARNIGRELIPLAPPDELVFAASEAGRQEVETMTGGSPRIVSSRAFRRVAVDLPRIARQCRASALLVQYTKPLTRRPCVVMVHDLSPFDPRSAQWLDRRFRARVRTSIDHSARTAATLITPSEFTRQGLIERYRLP